MRVCGPVVTPCTHLAHLYPYNILGQAPAAGEALAEVILSGKSASLDLAFFDPVRFVGRGDKKEEEEEAVGGDEFVQGEAGILYGDS
jgi:hypothetical protein